MNDNLTKAERDWLDSAAHNARFGWATLTGRTLTRRTAERLCDRGLLKSVGLTQVVDGDGFALVPERWREGYELTDEGKAGVARKQKTEQARGFAALDPELRREIAGAGGRKAHATGRAHRFTAEEAREAGKLGGKKISEDRDHMVALGKRGGASVSVDRNHMAEIGRKGGAAVSQDREHMRVIARKSGAARRAQPTTDGDA